MAPGSSFSFERLPPEIHERIILSIGDARSIYHLIVASPAASHLFEDSRIGPKVLEHAITDSMEPQVSELVRLVGIIRTTIPETAPASSLQDFLSQCDHRQKDEESSLNPALPLSISLQGQSRQTIRSIILLIRRIYFLTAACLEHYRNRCLSITPAHVEGLATYESAKRTWHCTWKQYQPRNIGPFSWVEEQRVMRMFWKLQMLNELKRAVLEGRLYWEMVDSPWEDHADSLFGSPSSRKEEFLTVVDFINHVRRSSADAQDLLFLPNPAWKEKSATKWPDSASPPGTNSRGNRDDLLIMDPESRFFFAMQSNISPRSPIRGIPFWPYRELGMAIWEQDTLVKLGLWRQHDGPEDRPSSVDLDIAFTWRSLLSQEVLAEVHKSSRIWKSGGGINVHGVYVTSPDME